MNIKESIVIAIDSIRVNKLRASLTLLSISIGVFAIMGAGTLVESFNNTVTGEMAALGENAYSVKRMPSIQMGGHTWRKYRSRKPITYSQYKDFRRSMSASNLICASSTSSAHTVEYKNLETNPDVNLIGTDENFFLINNMRINDGRGFSADDILFNRKIAIVGNDVVNALFPSENPLGKEIKIKNSIFLIVGTLQAKGAIMGRSQDNQVIVPLTQFLKYYASRWEESLDISVMAADRESLDYSIDEAIGILRGLRDVKPWEENSFEIETNESISMQFSSLTQYLSLFGFVSGFIALIAAGVGIMNIMLVSVKERTREIGIRKAVGAKRRWILYQFIIETITLSQVGGIIGILLGLSIASLFGKLMNLAIVFPISWIILSIVICTVLGIISGAYPAWKAAKLDPIDALRYE